MKATIDGFRFGMLLQLAIGPICLLIFKIAGSKGFVAAMSGVAAVVLVDSLFILFAIWGITTFVGRKNVKRIFNFAGAIIVGLFGIATILGTLGINLVPEIGLSDSLKEAGSFFEAFMLTAANPLTILFWAGVFSARLAEGKHTGSEVYFFGLGSALSTLISLTAVSLIGTLTGTFLPPVVVEGLNILIGLVLIFFGMKMLIRKDAKAIDAA